MITHLFKQSLDISELPPEWKTAYAYAKPIFKKDKRSDPCNYQPLSLTSNLCKTFEHILFSQIMNYLATHQILCPNQFGFRVEHSYACESQLLVTINDFAYALNKKITSRYWYSGLLKSC